MDRPSTMLDLKAVKLIKRLKNYRKDMYDDNYYALVLEALIYLVEKAGKA